MLDRRSRIVALLLLALTLAPAAPARSVVSLTGGKRLTASEGVRPAQDRITFRFAKDPGLLTVQSPLCPAQTTLRFRTDHQAAVEIALDCNKWRVAGSGFRYVDRPAGPGSAIRIAYRVGTLVVTVQGASYSGRPVVGPVDFLETRLTVGSQGYCGRWDQPPGRYVRNASNRVVVTGPTAACADVCGDGERTGGEQCDDGNTQNGDCCSATCTLASAGSACSGDGNACTSDVCDASGVCRHEPAPGASCDDGNGCTTGDVCVAGTCRGEALEPWINEIDYDAPGNDTGEFVELAGPAGKDLSGYHVVAVEGGGPLCLTGTSAAGQAYSIGTLAPGTVLGDDTGTGIGFLVVCFAGTSAGVAGCDVTLPGDASTSNLKDGDLLNLNATGCPDGVLLTNAGGGYVDSASWEGVVPATAPFGPLFHTFAAYAIERDEGGRAGVSIEKTSSTLARATGASEWRDPTELGSALTCQAQSGLACPTNTATPGAPNPTQLLACPIEQPYGSASRAFVRKPSSLLH